MSQENQLSAGFADPVHDAQNAFRRVLEALSRPGQRVSIGSAVSGLALGPATAHLLLALTDDDSAVWWQKSDSAAANWLRFHTGASIAASPEDAAFAVLSAANLPALDRFAAGSSDSPERSATLLIEVPSLDAGPAVEWRGPGIREVQTVQIAGLPEAFWTQWQANHASFPQGVDIVFTCAALALGLPRTTRVRRLEKV